MAEHLNRTSTRGAGGDLMNPEDAAKFIGVKKSSLAADRCRRSWGIPYFKLGSAVKYSRADLTAYLESCRVDHKEDEKHEILLRD